MDNFLGEIRLIAFTYAPQGWAFCNGQILPISQNTALFSLLGVYYGGDGRSNFALPNLQGQNAIGMGQGPGLSQYPLGSTVGTTSVTLGAAQIPAHGHNLVASSGLATLASPVGAHLAAASASVGAAYDTASTGTMPNAVGSAGGNAPHENRQPFLTLNYIIALVGIYPQRQ